MASGNRLVIGLDYGTTYTGVAYCESSHEGSHNERIEIIHDWPAQHTKIGTKEKVPSEITYQAEGIVWGSLIPPHVNRHMWTKLQLNNQQVGEAAKIFREVATSQREQQKQPVDIVSDFLAQVKLHLLINLDHKFGKALWRSLPITLVVTVPAVWSDLAKERTLQAVERAGFNSLEFPQMSGKPLLTTEPEAAAIYSIKTLRGTTQATQFVVGDGFILCDMGGGTVDLIAYRVTELSPTTVEEATVGCGDQCGGSFVDRAFLSWLEQRLGTTDFLKISDCRAASMPRISLSKKLARMLQDFCLEIKSGFSGSETSYLRLPTPLSAIEEDESRGIRDGEIKLTPEDMVSMFEFPLRRTYELVGEQLKQAKRAKKVTMKFVFMVGGFSESPYVYHKIKQFVESCGLQAIRPAYPWSAVARGAVARGLEGNIKAIAVRKCRRHYGIDCSVPFIKGKHQEFEAYICQFDSTKRAQGQMSWLLKRGDDLATSEESHAKLPFHAKFWAGQRREQTIDLLLSNEVKPPKRISNKSVNKVVSLTIDLSVVPKDTFRPSHSLKGVLYHTLIFDLEVSIQSSLEFFLSVKGKRYGSVTAAYE